MKPTIFAFLLLCGCHSAPQPSTVAGDINQAVTRGMTQPMTCGSVGAQTLCVAADADGDSPFRTKDGGRVPYDALRSILLAGTIPNTGPAVAKGSNAVALSGSGDVINCNQ